MLVMTAKVDKKKIILVLAGAAVLIAVLIMLFGGSNVDQQVLDEMKKKANLKDGQMLTNIRITAENEYIVGGIVIKKTVRGTADVVQFK